MKILDITKIIVTEEKDFFTEDELVKLSLDEVRNKTIRTGKTKELKELLPELKFERNGEVLIGKTEFSRIKRDKGLNLKARIQNFYFSSYYTRRGLTDQIFYSIRKFINTLSDTETYIVYNDKYNIFYNKYESIYRCKYYIEKSDLISALNINKAVIDINTARNITAMLRSKNFNDNVFAFKILANVNYSKSGIYAIYPLIKAYDIEGSMVIHKYNKDSSDNELKKQTNRTRSIIKLLGIDEIEGETFLQRYSMFCMTNNWIDITEARRVYNILK